MENKDVIVTRDRESQGVAEKEKNRETVMNTMVTPTYDYCCW